MSKNAKIIFGINQNAGNTETIKLTLLAVGCQAKSEFMGVREPESEAKETINTIVEKEIKKKKHIKAKVKKEKPKTKSKKKAVTKKKKARPAKMVQAEPVADIKLPVVRIENNSAVELMADQKVRRTALEVKKVVEDEEKELLEKESIWETPAILRRRDK